MLNIIAIGLGQLCALGVHAGCWWLRRKLLCPLAVWGFVSYGAAWYIINFYISMTDDSGGARSAPLLLEIAQEFRIALCGAVALGLYHSFLLGRRWAWWIWLGTTLAVFSEVGAAFVAECVGEGQLIRSGLVGQECQLFYNALWLTLAGLAMLHPFARRVMQLALSAARRQAEPSLSRGELRTSHQ